jgi:hypothetical protein
MARRVAEVVFRTLSRRHLARLDRTRPDRCQDRILRGLIHQARATPFGRDHDFQRIRSVADYRRLVPVQALSESGRAVCPASTYRAALRTALALVADSCPRTDLFRGPVLLLPEDDIPCGKAAEVLSGRLPLLVRPHARVIPEVAVAGECGRGIRPTCAIGPVERLLALADQRGASLRELWPTLAAVVWSGRPELAVQLRERVGAGVLLLKMVLSPAGPVAIEDSRLGGLRLLTDHGIYFEFLPPCGVNGTPRVGVGEVQPGVSYELLATSLAGAWSSRLGQGICFEGVHPQLVRLVDLPPAVAVDEAMAPRVDAATITPTQPPHRPAASTPTGLPGTFTPTPWSALAGRE